MKRWVYQSSRGGKQYAPKDDQLGLIGCTTPRFAKMVSWKYAHMPSTSVCEDLAENHCRPVSRSHIQKVSYLVGDKLLELEPSMVYAHGVAPSLVKAISVGRDGAMVRLKDGSYREAMVGTLSLVGANREVLHTIYLGDGPEYGKAGFEAMLDKEIADLKREFGHLPWVGLADGSAHNWKFLSQHVTTQIIDYWHAWQYIRPGLEILYPQEKKCKKQVTKWHDTLKEKEYSVYKLLNLFKKHRRLLKMRQVVNVTLEASITYLTNHAEQMNYAHYLQEGYLIGSGVTESACKTLIKGRLGGCGMRWDQDNTRVMTLMRGLVLTANRWKQAWKQMYKSAA